jgi:hypothetical protein
MSLSLKAPIRTYSPQPGVTINNAISWHPFNGPGGGSVTRISFIQGDNIGIATYGEGTNWTSTLAGLDAALGPPVFSAVDSEITKELSNGCPNH